MRMILRVIAVLAAVANLWAGAWSAPASATDRDGTALVTCRAKLAGEFLLIEVMPTDGWHVYAMDNERRAKEALVGKASLGVEQNTEVLVSGGLEQVGDWFQTEPRDFSQPELRWFSYGFDRPSLLASQVRRTGSGSAKIEVRAQACDSGSCISVEAQLELPVSDDGDGDIRLDGLVRVGGS